MSDFTAPMPLLPEPPPALLHVRPELPEALGAAVARALAKEPGARPQTAGELAAEAYAALPG
jgi:hypothetical protein